jgi:hypothetical protein
LARLADSIKENEDELKKVRAAIETIRTSDDAAVDVLVKQLDCDSLEEARKGLKAKEERIEKLLILYLDKEEKARLQQQSGAGTSMLPARQEDVILPGQRSCCIH